MKQMMLYVPDLNDLRELRRPWKLLTLGVGMGWLFYGALNYGISDWDIGVSVLMGGLTYVFAAWSVRSLLGIVRYPRSRAPLAQLGVALAALFWAWLAVDGIYVAYHTLMGNGMFRLENFYASTALYFLAGSIWLYRGTMTQLWSNLRVIFKFS
jgi:hypothetical protein